MNWKKCGIGYLKKKIDMEDLVIIGYGGHGKSVADSIIQGKKYNIIGYTDNEEKASDVHYLGTDQILEELFDKGVHNAALGIGFMGDSNVRDIVFKYAKRIGYSFPVILDHTAAVALDVRIGEGTYVGKNAIVNAGVSIGKCCIINSGAIVEHNNRIGNFSHVAVGAKLCGDVKVGEHSFIGAGTIIIQKRTIGKKCCIGAGGLVLADVPDFEKANGIIRKSK